MKNKALRFGVGFGALYLCTAPLLANVSVTSPTGGYNISTDKALNSTNGAAFTALGDIRIDEGATTDFDVGNNQTLILTVVDGWRFNAAAPASVTFPNSRDITSASASVTASNVTVTFSVGGTGKFDYFILGGLEVQALDGANVPGAGYIRRRSVNPGSALIPGIVNDVTTFGLLNQVAGAPSALTMKTQPPPTANAGVPFNPQPEVKVVDQFGNWLQLDTTTIVTAARAAGSGTLQGYLSQIAIGGIVTYTNLSHNIVGSMTIQFTAPNLTSITSDAIEVSPGPADRLVFTTQPGSASAGVPFGIQPVVKTRDQFGNDSTIGLPGNRTVTLTLTSGTGTLTGNTSLDIGTNSGNGVVAFTNLQIDAAGTNKQLTAGASGLTSAISSVFGVSSSVFTKLQLLVPGETAAPGTASGKTGSPLAQAAGTPFNVIVNAVDATWNVVNTISDSVGITSSDASATLPASTALVSGTKTLSVTLNTVGSTTVTSSDLTDGGKTPNTSPAITVGGGTPRKLTIQTQPSSTATAGTAFAIQPVIRVEDAGGNLVATDNGRVITVSRGAGTAALQGTLTATTVNGFATFTNLSYNLAETITLNFTASTLTNVVSDNIAVAAGPFTKLQVLVPGESAAPGTASGKTGSPIAQSVDGPFSVTVKAVDSQWNAVNTVTDLVGITSSDSNATLPANAALVAGMQNFNVTLNTSGTATLTASDLTDGSKTANTSPAVTVNAAQHTPASGGGAISADTTGGAWTGLSGPSYSENASGDVGTGTIVLNAPSGFIFDTGGTAPRVLITRLAGSGKDVLNINGVASGTAVAMTSVTSSQLTFTVTSPSSSGVTCSLTWQNVRVRPTAGTPLASGRLAAAGTASVLTLSTNSNLGNLREVAGAAAALAIQTQPSASATAGVAFAQQPVLQVRDQFGNLRSSANGAADNSTVATAARSAGSGTLQGTTSRTAANGIISFTNLSHNVATNVTILFSSGSLANVTSGTVTVSPAAADRLVFTTQPGSATYGSALSPQPVVKSRDPFGNDSTVGLPLSLNLNLNLSAGSGSLQGTAVLDIGTAAGNGTAAFSGLTVSAAGTGKQLSASASGLTGAVSSTFNVSPATVSGSIAAANKVYDGTTGATILSRTLSGVIGSDSVSLTGGTASFATKQAGSGKTVTATGLGLSGADAGNYQLASTSASTTADITARALVVSASGVNKIYDGTTTATVTLSDDRVAGDSLSASYSSASFGDKYVGTARSVSVSGISLTGTDAANYTANTTASATADITARTLTISATAANKVYDGTTAATVTLSDNRVAGDSLSTSYTSASFADKNIGTAKTVSVNGVAVTGTDAVNYSANTSASATADITAATVTALVTADNKAYDGTTTATVASRSLTGVLGSDVVSLTGGTATFANKNVGTGKTVTATGLSLSGTDAGNYQLAATTATTTADITARALTVSAAGVNKVYDGATSASVTLSDNRVAGDSLTTGYTSASFADKQVGTAKPVSVNGITVTGADAGNYTFNATASATANITAASVTALVTADNKIYDGNTAATIATRSLTGVLGGDTVSLNGGTATFASKSVGTGKTVTAIGLSLSGADAGNYQLASTSATTTADITARALIVSATGANKVYDGNTTATVTLSDNRVAGDSLNTSYGSANFADKNVGLAKAVSVNGIAVTGTDAVNYSANTSAGTTADISARGLSISATGVNKVYDGTTTATVTLSDNRVAGDSLNTSYTSASFTDKNVGPAKSVSVNGITLGGADAANYSANTSTTATANITAKALNVSGISANNKVYDANTTATLNTASAVLTGVVSGDAVALDAGVATGAFSNKNAGAAKTVTVSGLSLSGADAGNYTLAQPSTTADITQALLTVTADNKTRAADQPNPALTATFSGFVGGETLASSGVTGSPALSTTTTNVVGTYPISAAAGTLNAVNYSFTFADGTLTVTGGAASKLVILTQPSATATAGVAFAQQPQVRIEDAYGNLRSSDNATIVTAARSAGNGTLMGTTTATAVNGIATFANLSHTVANTISLSFSSSGLTGATSGNIVVSPAAFTKLQLLVPGEAAAPGTAAGKTGAPSAQLVGTSFQVTVNAVDAFWNRVSTVTDMVGLTSSDATATLPPATALSSGTVTLTMFLNTAGNFTVTASDLTDAGKTANTSPAIAVSPSQFTPATGGGAILADTTGGAWTGLSGPSYAENASGDVGTGTIVLNAPSGFIFDTGGTAPRVLITRIGGVGPDARNINGVASGTAVAMTSVAGSQLTFTVTSPSSSGVTCSLTWQNVRVRPTAGTPLASGRLVAAGTASVLTLSTNSNLGNLREVAGAAAALAIQTQPSASATAGVAFAQQPVLQVRDQFGNLRSSANGAADNSTVATAARSAGSGTLQGTTSRTAANGIISFTNLSHNVATNVTVSFTSAGLTSTASDIIAVGPAAADRLVFATQPGNGMVGEVLGSQPMILSCDQFGNRSCVGLGASKGLTIALSSGTGPLGGTTTADIGTGSGNGVATCTDLHVDSAGTNKQLVVSASGLTGATSSMFSVSQHSQTITFDPLANKTYGDASFTLSATASSALPVGFSVISGPASISGNTISISGGGTVTVRASQAGDAYWASATPVDRSFTVAKATLTVTADDKSRVYGDANPSLTASYNGFVNGENASVLVGSPSLSTTATASSPATGSSYAITISQGTLSSANYSFNFVPGTLAISKAMLTVTAVNKSRPYGAPEPPFTVSYNGFKNGDSASVLSGTPDLSTTATAGSAVAGSPYVISATVGTLSATNYEFSFVSGSLTITPAALSVSAADASRAYGQANPILGGTLSGVQNGDNISASYETSATTSSAVNTYPIVPNLADPDGKLVNYTVASTNGTLTVTPAALTGTVQSASRPYGQANPSFTVQYSGFANGEDTNVLSGAFIGTTTANENSPVGLYPIHGSGQSASNYSVTYLDGALTITPYALSVVAHDASRLYGQTNPILSGTLSGVQNGDNITVSYATAAAIGSPVGSYAIVPNLLDPDGRLTNYTVFSTNGTLTVSAASLNVVANNNSRAYGQANPIFSGTLSGVQNGDNITASYTSSATASSPAGEYDIIPSLSDPDGKLGNYAVSSVNGKLTVGKVTITVTADNKSRVYGAPNPSLTASYNGFVNGDDTAALSGSPALSTAAAANSSVAGSPYAITAAQGTLTAVNYDFTFVPGEMTITPASSANAVSASANPSPTGSNVTLTATLTGVAPSTGVPSGTVQFIADGSALGAPVSLTSGVANLTLSTLAHGIHTISAEYAGDGNLIGSTNALGSSLVINAVPIATLATYPRSSNEWIQISIPEFMGNHTSDADGDPLTLASVGSGTNDATVFISGDSIYYLPSNSNPNRNTTDHLEYIVTDGFAGGSVTNYIRISLGTATPGVPAVLTGINPGATGVNITFTGSAGYTYQIQRAAELKNSGVVWEDVGAATTDGAGLGGFTDSSPLPGQGFYRAVWR